MNMKRFVWGALLGLLVTGSVVVEQNWAAQQTINVGASANDHTGDTVRAAFQKTNANFTELYDLSTLHDSDTALIETVAGEQSLLVIGVGTQINASFTTKQNDYAPVSIDTASTVHWNGTTSTGVTGIDAQDNGREITFVNETTNYLLWFEHQSTASTNINRIVLPDGMPYFLMPGDSVTFSYGGENRFRWLVKGPRSPPMNLSQFNDFTTANPPQVVSGTAAAISFPTGDWTTHKELGVLQLTTGSTNSGSAAVGTGGTSVFPTVGSALSVIKARTPVIPTGTETFGFITGFFNGAVDNICIETRWDGSSAAEFNVRYNDNSAGITRVTTGMPAVGTTAVIEVIFLNSDWSRADVIISTDGKAYTLAVSPATNLPSSSTRALTWGASIFKTVGTTARTAIIDYMGLRYDAVRG